MRGRSYAPSPTTPRGVHGRKGRSPSPRGGPYRARSRDLPTSLFVRHLSHDCRQEDLNKSFKQFGPLKGIHLPRDHHRGDRRGFGYVHFEDPADAAEAKDHMDGYVLLGRRLAVVFAEDRSDGRFQVRRRSTYRYYSRSSSSCRCPPPRRSGDHYSPPSTRHHHSSRRSYSRSAAYNGSRGRSESPATSKSRSISRSPSPRRRRSSTPLPASRNRSPSPMRRRSNTPVPERRGEQ